MHQQQQNERQERMAVLDDLSCIWVIVSLADVLTCVVSRAAVVGGREEGDEVALRKALKPIHDALVRPYDHLQVILLQGGATHKQAQLQLVRSEPAGRCGSVYGTQAAALCRSLHPRIVLFWVGASKTIRGKGKSSASISFLRDNQNGMHTVNSHKVWDISMIWTWGKLVNILVNW